MQVFQLNNYRIENNSTQISPIPLNICFLSWFSTLVSAYSQTGEKSLKVPHPFTTLKIVDMSLQVNPVIPLVCHNFEINGHHMHKTASVDYKSMLLTSYYTCYQCCASSASHPVLKKSSTLDKMSARMVTFASKKEDMDASIIGKVENSVESKNKGKISDSMVSGNNPLSFSTDIQENSETEAAVDDMEIGTPGGPDTVSEFSKVINDTHKVGSISKVATYPKIHDIAFPSKQEPSRKENENFTKPPFSTSEKRTAFSISDKPSGRYQPGKNILDALKQGNTMGRSGKPVEPLNLFEDRKPRQKTEAEKFEFKLEAPELFILLSFTLISSVMLGTVYLVWKAGAIHFNEY